MSEERVLVLHIAVVLLSLVVAAVVLAAAMLLLALYKGLAAHKVRNKKLNTKC